MKKILVLLLLSFAPVLAAQPLKIHIWDGTPVGAQQVNLTAFLPEGSALPVPAVIVCPGGSYFWLDMEHEGAMVARWLQSQGFAAFLLKYRTAGWFNFTFRTRGLLDGHHYPDMLEDVQRAIFLVRKDAAAYGVDPDRIGTMGFSAGGHLAMLAAELSDTDFLPEQRAGISLRPDFVASIYPVVTLEDREFVHKRSRRGLLGVGRERDPMMRDSLSLEKHVTASLPPVFLLSCQDDPVVDCRNAQVLDSALTENKVRHLYVQYKNGGHGFGADPARFGDETRAWQETFLTWIKNLFSDEE